MNVIEYIKKVPDLSIDAKSAFDTYEALYPGLCKFEYFRTKYNNYKKENYTASDTEIKDNSHTNNHKIELKVNNYKNVDLSELISETIPTGTLFDRIVSDNGFVRKSVDAVAAKAGSGKTVSRLLLFSKAVELNPSIKAAMLSAEMVEHEIAKEVRNSRCIENVDFVYLVNYFRQGVTANQYWDLMEQCFKNYDLLIADSFSVIFEQLFELYEGKIKAKKLLFMLIDKLTKWTEKYNCNLQLILQCKRDGTYLGASALVHAISSLSYVHVYGQKRFIMFEKNRNNGMSVNREVFFSKDKETGGILFDEESYKASYEATEDSKTTMKDFIAQLQKAGAEKEETLKRLNNPELYANENQVDLEDSIEEVSSEAAEVIILGD
jgi:predicted ATP-dependent serine protease